MDAISPVSVQKLLALSRVAREVAFARYGLKQVDLLAPGGTYSRRRPRIVGIENLIWQREVYEEQVNATSQTYGSVSRLVFNDAIVTGQGTVITRNGTLLTESAIEFLNKGQIPDGLVRHGPEEFALQSTNLVPIAQPSLLVKRPWWRNYGHWLVDGAMLLSIVAATRMPSKWQIVVGAHEGKEMRAVMRDTIDTITPGIPVVEQPDNESWVFSDLHYITPVHVPPLFKLPMAVTSLRALFIHSMPPASKYRRVYIARADLVRRRLTNESVIMALCASRGFEIVYLEGYSIKEKARIFHESELVVGVKGAGLANAIFSPNSLAMIVLSPGTFPDPFFWDLAGQLSMDYTEIFGPVSESPRSDSQNDFNIDSDLFVAELDAAIARIRRH